MWNNLCIAILAAHVCYALTVDCQPPWTFSHLNSCYFMVTSTFLTWGEARVECMGHGGHLAIYDTPEEENFTTTYIAKHYGGWFYWIDGTDFETEGQWYWDHTGKPITHTNWDISRHEPNGRKVENCLLKGGSYTHFKWSDQSCDISRSYLCEKN